MTDQQTCPYCGERSGDGHLCHECTRATKRALRRIAKLWPTLQETITRQDKFGSPSEVRSDAIYGPVPFSERASATADDVRAKLVGWVKVCMEDYQAPCPADRVPAMCRMLVDYAPRLRTSPAAEEWADEIAEARDSVARAVDLPSDRAKVPTGPCPERTSDGEPCSGVVVAVYPKDDDERPRMDCTPPAPGVQVCAGSWTPEGWANVGERIMARKRQIDEQKRRGRPEAEVMSYLEPPKLLGVKVMLTIADAVVVCGVPRSTLYRWLSSGRVEQRKVIDPVGRPVMVVDPADVTRAWAESIDALEGVDIPTRRARVLDIT